MAGRYVERQEDGTRQAWQVERLWELSKALPVRQVRIDDIAGFDQVTWFSLDGPLPTCRAVAQHAKRIYEADLRHPVILSARGGVMDGMHRIARAWLEGKEVIDAVRFAVNPEPDELLGS